MDAFLAKHAHAIRGVLSCFDRVLLRGYLPLMSSYAMADFLRRKQVKRRTLKAFLLTQADPVKKHALSMAAAAKRPHQYLSDPTRKEDLARQIAERDGITDGLVCVFSVLDPCRTFALVWKEAHPLVRPAQRKCLQLYFYVLDPQLGLIHVKLQTWFPFPLQVYVNGHDWLARRFDRRGVAYSKQANVFVHIAEFERAQKLADGFANVHWPPLLGRYAHKVNPVARHDRTLFEVLMSGEHLLRGFTNRELREKLARAAFPLAPDPAEHSGQVTRLLRRLHAHQLIAKIPRSRR